MQKHSKTQKTLLLSSETVRNLNAAQLRQVGGGAGDTYYPSGLTCDSGKLTCICHDDY